MTQQTSRPSPRSVPVPSDPRGTSARFQGPTDDLTSAEDTFVRVAAPFDDVVAMLARLEDVVEGRTMTDPGQRFFYCGDSTALTASWDDRAAAAVLHLCGDDVAPWTDRLTGVLSRRLGCEVTAYQADLRTVVSSACCGTRSDARVPSACEHARTG